MNARCLVDRYDQVEIMGVTDYNHSRMLVPDRICGDESSCRTAFVSGSKKGLFGDLFGQPKFIDPIKIDHNHPRTTFTI